MNKKIAHFNKAGKPGVMLRGDFYCDNSGKKVEILSDIFRIFLADKSNFIGSIWRSGYERK